MAGREAQSLVEAMGILARLVCRELQQAATRGAGTGLGIGEQGLSQTLSAQIGRDAHPFKFGATRADSESPEMKMI